MEKAQVASPEAVMVATVVALQGKAFARDTAGNLRALKVGDVVHGNEELVCSTGSQVELLSNGVRQTFTNVDAVNIAADLFETAPATAQAPVANHVQQAAPAHSGVRPNTAIPIHRASAGNAMSFSTVIRMSVGACPLIS